MRVLFIFDPRRCFDKNVMYSCLLKKALFNGFTINLLAMQHRYYIPYFLCIYYLLKLLIIFSLPQINSYCIMLVNRFNLRIIEMDSMPKLAFSFL